MARQYNYPDYHAAVQASKNSPSLPFPPGSPAFTKRVVVHSAGIFLDARFFFRHASDLFPGGEITSFIEATGVVEKMLGTGLIPGYDHPEWSNPVVKIGSLPIPIDSPETEASVYLNPYRGEYPHRQDAPKLNSDGLAFFDCRSNATGHLVYVDVGAAPIKQTIGAELMGLYSRWNTAQRRP